MPFKKGDPKPPGSGKKKGAVNRATKEYRQRLAALGSDPIKGLVELAAITMESGEYGIARQCYSDLMKYAYPIARSTDEVLGEGNVSLMLVTGVDREPPQHEALTAADVSAMLDGQPGG